MPSKKSLQELIADLKVLLEKDGGPLAEIVWPKKIETKIRKVKVPSDEPQNPHRG